MGDRKVGRPPLKAGERSVHLGVRLTESEHRQLLAEVESQNTRLAAEGIDATVTPASVARRLIVQGLGLGTPKRAGSVAPSPVIANGHSHHDDGSEPSTDDVAASGSDERHVRPKMHGRRVRSVAEGTGEPDKPSVERSEVVGEGDAAAGKADEPTPGVTAEDVDRMLEGTGL